jgi:putative transposase
MIERDHPKLSLVQQCLLLSICRSSLYYESKCTVLDDEYLVKEAIDRQYMITPYYGVRRMKVYLTSLGYIISRERVARYYKEMRLTAIYPKPHVTTCNEKHGKPEIFNTDQGSEFTASGFTSILHENGIQISMDGKGRALDNIFVERLWRSVKYECVYLERPENGAELQHQLSEWFRKYNDERPHQSLQYKTPDSVYHAAA